MERIGVSETPIPTPWAKGVYEASDGAFIKTYLALRARNASEDEIERYIAIQMPEAREILKGQRFADRTGAFEGAKNQACEVFRPQAKCIMFTLTPRSFCSVCSNAIRNAMALHTH